MQIVHKIAFFGKKMEKWPYFEEKKSHDAIFR
jgi:hypothetical protein